MSRPRYSGRRRWRLRAAPGVLLLDAAPPANLYRDGIHPSADGNAWLAERIAAALGTDH